MGFHSITGHFLARGRRSALGIVYQQRIYAYDNCSISVLEDSKEGLAESITEFYANKIKAGQIDELADADKKLRKIFDSTT